MIHTDGSLKEGVAAFAYVVDPEELNVRLADTIGTTWWKSSPCMKYWPVAYAPARM